LNLDGSDVDISAAMALLKLTGLVDLSLAFRSDATSKSELDRRVLSFIQAVIGEDPNRFALPNIESLGVSNAISARVLPEYLPKLLAHPACADLRRFPVPLWLEDDTEARTNLRFELFVCVRPH
jgi:hypothetical protein